MRKGGVQAAIVAIVITCGVGAAAAFAAADHTVEAHAADTVWHPAALTIQTGDKVIWTFEDGGYHNVESDSANWSFTSGTPPSDAPAEYTFTTPGTYDFVCEIHPGTMYGTITVQDEPATPTPDPTESPSPTPSPTPIPQPGGTHPTTPAPSGSADTVKPAVRSVKTKALRRGVRVKFRLSEAATVTVRVKRGKKVVKARRVQAAAGAHAVTLRSKKLKKGRYKVEVLARDAAGNRSTLASKRLRLRR